MGKIAVDNSEANKALDETGSSAEKAQGRLSGAFGKVSSAGATLAKGVGFAAAGVAGVVGSMIGLSTSTEDYAVQQGKLTTAFETTGKTADQANATYSELNAVLGDSDTAVEAAGNIAQLARSQSDLDKWTTIATGAYATFGDGLPIEGLAEAANETAKCGTVTGSMADALNWTSASMDTWNTALSGNKAAQEAFNAAIENGATKEDAFNAALAACNDEGERAQLVTDTLNGLYAEAGEKYRENNEALLESRKAQDEWNSAIGRAGEAVRPFATALLEIGTTIVEAVLPYLEDFSAWASEALPVVTGAFEQFAGYLSETFGAIGETLQPVFDAIKDFFMQFGLDVESATGVIDMFKEPAGELNGVLESMGSFLQNIVDNGFERLQTVLEAIDPYIEPFVESVKNLGRAFGENLGPAIESILGLLERLNDFWTAIIKPVIDTVVPIVMEIATTVMNKAAEIADFVLPKIESISGKIQEFCDVVQPKVEAAMRFIQHIMEDVWPNIKQVIDSALDQIQNNIEFAMNFIENIIGLATDIIEGDWGGAWEHIENIAGDAWDWICRTVQNGWNFIRGIFGTIGGVLGGIWEGVWSSIENAVRGAWDSITRAVQNGVNNVVNWFRSLPGKITGALGNLGSTLSQAGRDLINGFTKGISDAAGGAIEKAKSIASSVAGRVKSFLGIKSPSRVFMQIGRYTVEGLEVGFDKESDNAVKSVEGSVKGIVDAANKTVAKHPLDSMTVTQTATQATLDGLARSIDDLYGLVANYMPQLLAASDKQIVLNTGALVGATAGAYDTELGNISRRRARGQ